jgi:hypothetical protein
MTRQISARRSLSSYRSISRRSRGKCRRYESIAEFSRGMEAICGKFLERPENGSIYVLGNRSSLTCYRSRTFCHHPRNDRLHRRTGEWRFTNEHFI